MEQFNNFAYATLTSGINSTATSLGVQTGEGARFPATPFFAVLWDYESYIDSSQAYQNSKAEIVKVTDITTDTFTIERAQKDTNAVDFSSSNDVKIGQGWLKHNIDELITFTFIDENYTASRGEKINTDTSTSSGGFTLTLPSSPSNGDMVIVNDATGNWETDNLIVSGNGNNIDGAATFTCDVSDYLIYFIYNGTQWEVR
jgi:hypothetical protein